MPTKQMVPPDDGSRNNVSFNSRTYSSTPNVPIAVQSFDVPVLEANGWSTQLSVTSSTSSDTVYGKLKRLAKAARFSNPHVLPGPTSPPVVSVSTTAPSGLTNIKKYQTAPEAFAFYGGNLVQYATDFTRVWVTTRFGTGSGNVANDPPLDGVAWRVEAMVDATKVGIGVLNLTTPFRFIVDGQYVDLNGTAPPGGGGAAYFTLDFTAVGGRKLRRIAVEGEQGNGFRDFRVGSTESIYAVPNTDRLRMVIGGDSITAATGATRLGDGWPFVLGDCLGIKDVWASGSGSTGYLATAGGTKYTLRQRITDLTGPSPDIIGIAMGINDAASSVASIQAELALVLAAIRAVKPATPIFVFGSFLGNVALATIQALESGLKAIVTAAQVSDQNLFFVPITGTGATSDSPWIFGTGRSGAITGDGNADLYTGGTNGADAVHPTTAGHVHIGVRAADGMIAAIANKA